MVQTGLHLAKTESLSELKHAEFDNLSFYETNYAHIGLVEGKNSQPSKKRNKFQDLRRYPGFFSITFNFSENSNYWRDKTKHCWVMSTNFLYSKVCPAMFCP